MLTLGLLAAAGCEHSYSGIVTSTSPPTLLHYKQYQPHVHITLADGKETRLGKIGGQFYLVAWVEPPAEDAGYIDPRVTKLAEHFSLDSVPVIQFTLPTSRCELAAEQRTEAPQPTGGNLWRIFDPHRKAWDAFYNPEAGTVMLIDRGGNLIPIIELRARMDKLGWIINRTEDLETTWQQWKASEDI